MKRLALVAWSLALLVALAPRSWSQAVPSDIQAFYAKFAAANQKKDIKTLENLAAPDFTYIDKQGQRYDVAQMKQVWHTGMALMQNLRVTHTIAKVTVKGKVAAVIGKTTFAADLKNQKTGKVDKFLSIATTDDRLVKTGDGWKVKKTTVRSETTTLNGKPMQGM